MKKIIKWYSWLFMFHSIGFSNKKKNYDAYEQARLMAIHQIIKIVSD